LGGRFYKSYARLNIGTIQGLTEARLEIDKGAGVRQRQPCILGTRQVLVRRSNP